MSQPCRDGCEEVNILHKPVMLFQHLAKKDLQVAVEINESEAQSFLGELSFAPKGTCFVSFLPGEDTTSSLPSICLSFFMRTVWSSMLCIQYQLPCDNHISALALSILNGFLMSLIHKACQNLTGCPLTF